MAPFASRFAWINLIAWLLSSCPLAKACAGSLTPPTQVTTSGGYDPTVSPDGAWVAYRNPLVGIERIRLSDAKVETLFAGAAFEPDWSRTNGLILIRSQEVPSGLFTLDPATKAVQLVTNTGFDDGAVWSPLGDGIAAQNSSPDGLVFITYPGGESTPIPCIEPDQTACGGEDPTWSPDGQWIAFYDGPVEKVSRSGGQAEYVTQQIGSWPSWSPDGKWIAFVTNDLGSTEFHIWVTDARGSSFGVTQITDGPYDDEHPTWSPQSGAIYFDSDRSGQIEIWQVPFDPSVPVLPVTWGRLKATHR